MFGLGYGDRVICGSNDALLTLALERYDAEQALDPQGRIIYITSSILLVLIGGISAGLTLGLLSLSPIDLELIKRTAVSNKDRRMALKVERVTRNPHQLLVCLLVVNAACMECLPLLLDRLLNPIGAIIISVSAILIFSEVVPQAICKKYGLQIGASLAWLVHIMMFITWPVSYPIGKLLDWSLGSHGKAFFRRAELKEFVTLHGEAPVEEGAAESVLTTEECQIIHGALDMANKTAETAMTPLDKVFSIPADAAYDRILLQQIIEAGHSRVPVYESTTDNGPKNIIGLILVKELLMHEPNGSLKIKECTIRQADFLMADTPLYSVMQLFQMKRRHMAVVTRGWNGNTIGEPQEGPGRVGEEQEEIEEEEEKFENFVGSNEMLPVEWSNTRGEVIGIITLEDVLEELLQTEWQDETDRFLDNRYEERVAPTPKNSELPPGLLRYVVAEWHQQIQRRETSSRQGLPLLSTVASAPALVSSRISDSGAGKSFRRQTRVQQRQQQQHRHLAGAPPNISNESGEGGGVDDENVPLLDV
ncbi:hypothetical protein Ndes2526B_g06751 [Nannochloris sp. 'desiccata']|nr:hypothetical protein KSW81_005141 [Chlorella desiccata (nom. nud.)]KAH7617861.1 putative DUF21 domain-containing protein [Chlorella desiccata (nom. nud.)]